jgi:DNA-binding FadR family transcriptional regulator
MMDNLNKTSASRPEKTNAQQGKINPVNRSRVSDQILVQLTNLILDGTYPPGSKLPPERQLAMQFEVNRASLREALRRLESMGMIYVRQGAESMSRITTAIPAWDLFPFFWKTACNLIFH